MSAGTSGTPFPLGAYVGTPNGSSASGEAAFESEYNSFVSVMGTAPQFLDVYVDYTQPVSSWVSNAGWGAWSEAQSPDARNLTPVIGLPMMSIASGSPSALQQYQAFASGQYDSVLQGIVEDYAENGFTNLVFRPGWEMNMQGPTYAGSDAATQAAWVAAFQHIYTVLHQAAAADGVSVQVVWNPGTTNYSNAEAIQNLYPGNNYVDVIGADVYSDMYPYSDDNGGPEYHNWDTGGTDSSVAQFISDPVNREHYWTYPAANVYSNDGSAGHSISLDNLIQFAEQQGKPFAIPETGAGNSWAGTDVTDDPQFPMWLSQQLTQAQAAGLQTEFVNIWDSNGGGSYEFSNASDNKPLEAAAWAQYFGAQPGSAASPSSASSSTGGVGGTSGSGGGTNATPTTNPAPATTPSSTSSSTPASTGTVSNPVSSGTAGQGGAAATSGSGGSLSAAAVPAATPNPAPASDTVDPVTQASPVTDLSSNPGSYTIVGDGSGIVITPDDGSGAVTVAAGGSNAVQFANGDIGIPDPSGAISDVARLYQAAFNRQPDVSGLQYWASQETDDVPLSAIAATFASSSEFVSDYGSLGNSDYVNQLYQNVLHRDADSGGLNYWTQALESGTSRGDVLNAFAQSTENEAATIGMAGDPDNAEAYRLYQAAFGRAPDSAGQSYWASALSSGETPVQVAQGFTQTPEFQAVYGNQSGTGFVDALYQNVLGRAPDSAGASYWANLLASGTSEAAVLQGIADSPENRAGTAAATHDGWVLIGS